MYDASGVRLHAGRQAEVSLFNPMLLLCLLLEISLMISCLFFIYAFNDSVVLTVAA